MTDVTLKNLTDDFKTLTDESDFDDSENSGNFED